MKYALIIALLLIGAVTAVPGVSQQFYGKVTTNGHSAVDGLFVKVQLPDGTVLAETVTKNGNYGLRPDIFYVKDPNGNRAGATLEVFVNSVKATEVVFMNGGVTELNLAVTGNFPALPTQGTTSSGSSGSSGGGGGGSSRNVPTVAPVTNDTNETSEGIQINTLNVGSVNCIPNWVCGEWQECFNGLEKRLCVDANTCDTDEGRPEITRSCALPVDPALEKTGFFPGITGFVSANPAGSGGLGVLLIVVIVTLVWYYRRK